MTRARKHIVCLDDTPYYHITSRCVRRAFLCGVDRHTGTSYEHRRAWVEDRVRLLSSIFSIEIAAYAIMSNHYHLVVRIDLKEPDTWSDEEVFKRWTALFRGPILVQRYLAGESLAAVELDTVRDTANVYRARLGSLSWFMKCLNEAIARRANAEDGCTGHFWEARFHSQPLRSERALLTAMAYVDLNPVRAGIAPTPEYSDYTSIKERLSPCNPALATEQTAANSHGIGFVTRPLMAFGDVGASSHRLPIKFLEYVALVEMTGRAAIGSKRGQIDPTLAPALSRLGMSADQWCRASNDFRRHFRQGDLTLDIAV
jgi:REP element-mobilizing transposase RayT